VQQTMTQARRWLATCLAMLLVVTGLLPAMPVNAAWTGLTHTTTSFLKSPGPDATRMGTSGSPVEVNNRLLRGIQLTNSTATGTASVRLNGNPIGNVSFSGGTVNLPDITLEDVSTNQTITVQTGADTVTLYYRYDDRSSGGGFTANTIPNPSGSTGTGSSADPIVTSVRTISGMNLTYTDASYPTHPIQVYVGSTLVQTISATSGVAFTVSPFDLDQGINPVRIRAVNTGYETIIYYEYQSSSSPIILNGFNGDGTSVTRPYLHTNPTITINGVYGVGVEEPRNLRLKIATNNGRTVEDLAQTAPTVDTSRKTFTFTDIPLSPGMNVISFYERVGSVTREHYKFYVQYNNTPFLDAIKANNTTLGTGETLITVPSLNRLTLNVEGVAKNAETVEVTNTTTGVKVSAGVTRAGTFSVNMPSQLGANDLEIVAYNANKRVGVLTRKIFVVTTDRAEAHQFYRVTSDDPVNPVQSMSPTSITTLQGTGNPTATDFTFAGQALLMFAPSATQRLTNIRFIYEDESTGDTWEYEVPGTSPVAKGNGFTEYTVTHTLDRMTVPDSGETTPLVLEKNKTYSLHISYGYETLDTVSNTWVDQGYVPVNNYTYEFRYVDVNDPRFGQVRYGSTVLNTAGNNVINRSSITLNAETFNMTENNNNFAVTYNGTTLNNADVLDFTPAAGMDLNLNNLAAGSGTLEITYDPDGNLATPDGDEVIVSYRLYVETTPYIQLTYVDGSGQIRTFEDGYEIRSDDDFRTISGRVYNYNLTSANISAKIGTSPDLESVTTTGENGTFTISAANIRSHITSKGSHTLEITLTTAPSVTFTYTILYVSAKAPKISDVELKISENGRNNPLTKRPTDTAYRTGAAFLSEFNFIVQDANHVYIEKNGNRIADYRYEDGDWELQDTNQDYVETLQDIPDALDDEFEDYTFQPMSRTKFQAKMNSRQYGELLEEVQDEVRRQEDVDNTLALFPLNLRKNGSTVYTIVAEDENGAVLRQDITIDQETGSWEVISPVKARESDPYIIVNANSVPIKVFAENANKVLFGKTEAKVTNTTNRDFYYNDDLGKSLPETYYVFTATVPLKKGLNKIKFTVQFDGNSYNDEIEIFNASSSVSGAEYRDVLGKKVSFSVFDKALELKFPAGTVLLAPSSNRAGEEVLNPSGDIFVDVPLYFGIADRVTGRVNLEGDSMEDELILERNFNYASPLYYIDAGDTEVPGGRDPYYEEGDAEEFRDRIEDNLVPSRRGTLTIAYDPSIVNAAHNVLTVFYNQGDGWKNIGGVVNTGKKSISVPFAGFGYYMVMKTRESFDDVVGHDFARDALETLYSKGIMPAYSGASFGANRDITRGEFATMLVKALDLPINAGPYSDSRERNPLEPTFLDVRPSLDEWDYQYKYIETAARAGIARGTEPGYFRPSQPLTREEAAVMIARAMNLKLTGSPEAGKANLAKMFTDGKDVSFYAATSVLAVTKAKIMNGEQNSGNDAKPTFSFKPRSNLTRAEMAVITVRILQQLKKLPK